MQEFGYWEGCPLLRELDISYSTAVTNEGFAVALQHWSHLQQLHMLGCRGIGDAFVVQLPRLCPQLAKLYVTGSENVTLSGLRVVVRGCRKLLYLDNHGTIRTAEDQQLFQEGMFYQRLNGRGWWCK